MIRGRTSVFGVRASLSERPIKRVAADLLVPVGADVVFEVAATFVGGVAVACLETDDRLMINVK